MREKIVALSVGSTMEGMNNTAQDLQKQLNRLDGASYGNLKRLKGSWDLGTATLSIDRVQSDPYAPPSRLHAVIDASDTALPQTCFDDPHDRVAGADFLARDLSQRFRAAAREFSLPTPGQEILARSSVVVDTHRVHVRFTFQFPAAGRRVKGRAAARLLTDVLPELLATSALGSGLDTARFEEHLRAHTDYLSLRSQLSDQGLVAFVANGSVLPRAAGHDDRPARQAVAFQSPPELETTVVLPSGRTVTGMGIPRGVSLIVGGGFHGKSTLLQALQRGVYAHVPGDGRELVACDPTAVSVRAEDGRAVTGVNISGFINNLPNGTSTENFTTANASGSTSQAANVAEALEMGAKTLLIDEDTSATNFMIRDADMAALISADREPITPFTQRVRELYERHSVSTVLVVGGSGAFFGLADTVIAMDSYTPHEVTERAHQIAASSSASPVSPNSATPALSARHLARRIDSDSLIVEDARKPPRARGLEQIQIGREDIDLRYLHQLVDAGQTQAIALIIPRIARRLSDRGGTWAEAVEAEVVELQDHGLDQLCGVSPQQASSSSHVRGDLVIPRAAEIAAAINRWRKLRVR